MYELVRDTEKLRKGDIIAKRIKDERVRDGNSEIISEEIDGYKRKFKKEIIDRNQKVFQCYFDPEISSRVARGDIANMAFLKNLRYTKNTPILSMNQRVFYERNGYLVFPSLVPQNLLDKCRNRFNDIISSKVPPSEVMIIMRDIKDRSVVNKIQDFNQDNVLKEYIEYKKILDLVEGFVGSNIMAVHSMLIAKPPDAGYGSSKHPPHQDLYYFPFRPANHVVAAWTAMETCDEENGCLYVSPGSHLQDRLYAHDYPPGDTVNKFYHGIQDLPQSTKWINLEMQPGDTVFFHPLLIHGSGVNRSKRTRMAISCHYAAAECHYIDVSNTVQSRIRDEILEHTQKRYPGVSVDYTDVWRFKSTLVRGIRSSL